MLKFLQKSLPVLAITSVGLATNAQGIKENFRSWTETNVKMGTGYAGSATTANDADMTCDAVMISAGPPAVNSIPHGINTAAGSVNPISKTVTYPSGDVTYTITNAAIVPNCKQKSFYGSSTSPASDTTMYVTRGYVELNKSAAAGTVGATFTTSAIPYVDSIVYTTSGTSSNRPFKAYTSTDGGTTWVDDPNTAPQPNLPYPGLTGKPGDLWTISVKKANVMFKIESFEQIIRIHDFIVFTTPTSISAEAWYTLGAKVRVEGNTAFVTANYNGNVEILNTNGVVVSQNYIVAGAESSFNIPTSGIYIVRLSTASKMASKKIIVQ